jgi:hypothetical protein
MLMPFRFRLRHAIFFIDTIRRHFAFIISLPLAICLMR